MNECSRDSRGFTLLEVMLAVTVLSLGLTIVFGSTVMSSRAAAHGRFVTQGAMLAQCRMTAVEAYLRASQLPESDQALDDPPETGGGEKCCEAPYTCVARVEKIVLPEPIAVNTRAGDSLLNGAVQGARALDTASGSGGGAGAIGQLAGAFSALNGFGGGGALPTGPGAGLPGMLAAAGDGGLASVAPPSGASGGLAGAGAPSMQGMAGQLLGGIYPTIKPLLEGAIRKVTVAVVWHEGSREFRFDVVQYVTNPGQTLASGEATDALTRALQGAGGTGAGGSTGSSTSTGGTTSTTTAPR